MKLPPCSALSLAPPASLPRFTLLSALLAVFVLTATAGPINYTYDAAGRLVLVDYGGGTNLYKVYDRAGNLQSRSAPGPVLKFTADAAHSTFSWPASGPSFTVVSAPNLTAPINWTPVAITPVLVGDHYVAQVSRPSGTIFYSIRRGP